MTDYVINYQIHSFTYNPDENVIRIGNGSFKHLTDSEILEYTSDALTHEHIHKVLYELFGYTPCRLFDLIEHHFNNNELHARGMQEHQETYQAYIKKVGINKLLDDWNINNDDISNSHILCGNKPKRGI